MALSQVYKDGQFAAGSHWLVPAHLYSALRQDAVLLLAGRGNPAASALLACLRREAARRVIRS